MVPLYWAPACIIIFSDLISPIIRPDLVIVTTPFESTFPIKTPLKERFNEYLENNIEEQYLKNPEFYLSSDVNEKRFYLQIKEFPKKTDQYDDRDFREYFLIVKPLDTERVEMTDVKF